NPRTGRLAEQMMYRPGRPMPDAGLSDMKGTVYRDGSVGGCQRLARASCLMIKQRHTGTILSLSRRNLLKTSFSSLAGKLAVSKGACDFAARPIASAGMDLVVERIFAPALLVFGLSQAVHARMWSEF